MKKLPTVATPSPTSKTYADFAGRVHEQVTATMQGRRGGRHFVIPQSTDSATEQENTAHDCPALDGECVSHENDFGDIIHTGPESSITVGDSAGLLPIHLVKWNNDKPYIVFGWDAIELDLAAADAAIEAEQKHLDAFREARAHLAAALAAGQQVQA